LTREIEPAERKELAMGVLILAKCRNCGGKLRDDEYDEKSSVLTRECRECGRRYQYVRRRFMGKKLPGWKLLKIVKGKKTSG
jgi:hypothetical protein